MKIPGSIELPEAWVSSLCRTITCTRETVVPVFLLTMLTLVAGYRTTFGAEASPPDFGPSVLIFDPSMSDIQRKMDAIYRRQESGEFNANRYAYLFKPGKYSVDVQLGYYMQAMGLGRSPDDVLINGAVRSKATWRHGNATCNFWRCAENLSVTPTEDANINVWAVSQGTALRRVHIKGDLNLSDGGWSSGGFIADCKIDGTVNAGTQQQWLSRNADWGAWRGGDWNMVFVGTSNPPAGNWPEKPYTVVEKTPIEREKPYLIVDETNHYFVMVPGLHRDGTTGITWGQTPENGTAISIDRFYLAHPDRDNAATINAALAEGKNLIFTPGVYHLEDSIRVMHADTVILGLGYATLVPDEGTPAMVLSDVDGLKVGGLLFAAGKIESPTLLQVGEPGAKLSHVANPIFLYDIFCRAGGSAVGRTMSFVMINSSNVVGDNSWLWRADHGAGAAWTENTNANGLTVNGNDVTFYGLFVEHCQGYQTIWNGNGGRVYFYQSEMPYDPPSQSAWSHDSVKGFASYKVGDGVTTHEAFGVGVYCVFAFAPVIADSAIEAPDVDGVKLHHMVTLRFGGQPGSGIAHVIDGRGGDAISHKFTRMN